MGACLNKKPSEETEALINEIKELHERLAALEAERTQNSTANKEKKNKNDASKTTTEPEFTAKDLESVKKVANDIQTLQDRLKSLETERTNTPLANLDDKEKIENLKKTIENASSWDVESVGEVTNNIKELHDRLAALEAELKLKENLIHGLGPNLEDGSNTLAYDAKDQTKTGLGKAKVGAKTEEEEFQQLKSEAEKSKSQAKTDVAGTENWQRISV